jgi:thiamine-monophosphate kinase
MGANPRGHHRRPQSAGHHPLDWVERLYQGMAACLQRWGGVVIGGDLCRSDTISLAITALGSVAPNAALYRHGPNQVRPFWPRGTMGCRGRG